MIEKKQNSSLTKISDLIFLLIFSFAIFASYLTPQFLSFIFSDNFMFVNAWDEETYLSYQGTIGARNVPGHYVLYISSWLHELGVSGSLQNLFSDFLIPPLTLFFLFESFLLFFKDKKKSLFFSIIILFSSVLFNYANPLIREIYGLPYRLALIMPGWETYPSILRTPNPQFSYLLIAFSLYLYLRLKRWYLLVLLLPLLYYYVLVPYLYILVVIFLQRYKYINGSIKKIFLDNLIAYVFVALVIKLLFYISGGYSEISEIRLSHSYIESRSPIISLAGLICVTIYCLICIKQGSKRKIDELIYYHKIIITIILCMLGISNLQIINGFILAPKNYQDYAVSILAGFFLAFIWDIIHPSKIVIQDKFAINFQSIAMYALLILIFSFTIKSQGFSPFYFKIWKGYTISDPQKLEKIKNDPLHAIIPSADLSSKIAYSVPKMLIPPFSYQYRFPFIQKQCRYNDVLMQNAIEFVKSKYSPESGELKNFLEIYNLYKEKSIHNKTVELANSSYCEREPYESKKFYVIEPAGNPILIFPNP